MKKYRKTFATSVKTFKTGTKLQKNIHDSILTKERLSETSSQDAFEVFLKRLFKKSINLLIIGNGFEKSSCRRIWT